MLSSGGADNATLLSSGKHGVSNGHARPGEAYRSGEEQRGTKGTMYNNSGNHNHESLNGPAGAEDGDDDDDEDDMPATLERLRDPRRRNSGGSSKGSSWPAGGSTKKRDAKHERSGQHHKNGGSRRDGSWVEPSLPPGGDVDRERTKGSSSVPNRLVVEPSPYPAGDRIKPAPLTKGALATPASAPFETKLERGRGKAEAPWLQLDDLGDALAEEVGSPPPSSALMFSFHVLLFSLHLFVFGHCLNRCRRCC